MLLLENFISVITVSTVCVLQFPMSVYGILKSHVTLITI